MVFGKIDASRVDDVFAAQKTEPEMFHMRVQCPHLTQSGHDPKCRLSKLGSIIGNSGAVCANRDIGQIQGRGSLGPVWKGSGAMGDFFAELAHRHTYRIGAASVLVLLTILGISASASAQEGLPDLEVECGRGVMDACFALRYRRCAHENPRIAIPACTRQLLDRNSAWNNQPDSSKIQMDRATQYALRGTAHAKQGDIDQALADYDRAIRAYGNVYWIHALRGSALFAIDREQEARASFNEALSLAPNDALLLNARGRLLATALDENVRNGPQAIADAQRASELEPGRPAFVAALATAYAENGEFEKAVDTQQHAIDLLGPEDQGAIGTYLSRLELYQQGMPFRRELCEKIEDSSDPDREINSPVLSSYLVFCFLDGT